MKFSALLLVLLVATVQAEVYKSINASGEVVYSDIPSQGAKPVEMPALPTYTPAPLPVAPPQATAPERAADETYSAFSLTKPQNDETIRPSDEGVGIVNISAKLEPELMIQSGHRIQFFLDGKPQGRPLARLSTSFLNVDRGTHSVSAAVVDDSGEAVINAPPVTIHVKR
jgi:hypothetical protein